MRDDSYGSHSQHKRKHDTDGERHSRRKHRKHKSQAQHRLPEVEALEASYTNIPADVIEIHGSSSEEEGQISDSEKSEEILQSRKHKRSHRGEESRSRHRAVISSNRDQHQKESRHHNHCKKHRKHRVSEESSEKKDRRAQPLPIPSSHRRKKKEKEMSSERIYIKQEPDINESDEEVRPKVEVKEESRESHSRSRERSRSRAHTTVKDERPNDTAGDSLPGTSVGRRRRRDEENTEYGWGSKNNANESNVKTEPAEKDKPDFKLSGKLTEDRNMFNGVVIKYSEPPESRMPKKRWRLYPFKGDEVMPTMYIHRQSAYLIGRDRKVADLPIDHPSCSKQHAALQYRLVSYNKANGLVGKAIRLYIIDLESANGTFVNNKKIESKKYVELLEKDVIKFGFSSREYVLLHEGSKGDESDDE